MPQTLLSRAVPAGGTTAAFVMLPFSIGFTMLHIWSEMAGCVCRAVWSPTQRNEQEGHSQLPMPDTIEAGGEKDLFA